MTLVFYLAILVEFLFVCLFVVVFFSKSWDTKEFLRRRKCFDVTKVESNQQPEHGPLIGTQPKVEENKE